MTTSAKEPRQSTVQKTRRALAALPHRKLVTGLGVLAFAVVGTVLLVSSHAATPTANFESEGGTVSSPATTVADTGASGGSAVKFAASTGTPGCTPLSYIPAGFPNNCTTGYKKRPGLPRLAPYMWGYPEQHHLQFL